jgi:hypothetical protein
VALLGRAPQWQINSAERDGCEGFAVHILQEKTMKFQPKQKSSNFRLTFKTRSAITTIGLLKTCAKARTWTSSKLSNTSFTEQSLLQKLIVNKKPQVGFIFYQVVPFAKRGVGGGAFSGRW